MGGKNENDPIADFFGEDTDWLDDETGSVPKQPDPAPTLPPQPAPELKGAAPERREPPVRPPVPPPPPPPLKPATEAFRAAPTEPRGVTLEERQPPSKDPAPHNVADDTVGSFLEPVSEGPPVSAPDDQATLTDDEPGPFPDVVVEEDRAEDIADLSNPGSPSPLSRDEPSEEIVISAQPVEAPEPEPDEGPAPVRDDRVSWSPSDEETTWRELCEPVERLARSVSDEQVAAALLIEAARIRRDRLGEPDEALSLLEQAKEKGATGPEFHALLSETAVRLADYDYAARAMADRAERLTGAAAAEAWQAAGMIARRRLRDLEMSERHLRRAVKADPSDYASLSLLRDQLAVKGREAERAEVLQDLSKLASGRVAAEAWWELGRLYLGLDEINAARAAFEQGRAADPSQAQCFLSLQTLYQHLGDDMALGQLYMVESKRAEGPDAGQWAIEAARAFVDAREVDAADEAFGIAVEHGHPLARREQQAWFVATQRHRDYERALVAEIEELEGEEGVAHAWYRLGWLREHELEDLQGALTAYRSAVDLDAAAGPAAESVARVLLADGQYEELIKFWQRRVEAADDPDLRCSVLLRMAEISEAHLSDDHRARAYLEQLLGIKPEERTALESLRRIYRRLKSWAELAVVYETLASIESAPEARAQHLARAGNVWRYEAKDPAQARDCYGRALELQPGHAIALDEQVDLLEDAQEWEEQARVLRSAADAVLLDDDKVRLSYRSGRVWLDRVGDPQRAGEAFRNCLRYNSGFLPALGMLKQIAARSDQGQEIYRLYLQQAQALEEPSARHWRLLAAANLADRLTGGDPGRDLGAILERDPTHPGAVAAQELRLLSLGAKVGLLNLYRRVLQSTPDSPRRVVLNARVAGLFEALGDDAGSHAPLTEAIQSAAEGTPFRALARLAESRRLWDLAVHALEKSDSAEDRLERARLLTVRLKRPDEALELYKALLSLPETALGAALGTAALAQRTGDTELLARAHGILSEHVDAEPVSAAHALWSGQLAEAAGLHDEALTQYHRALELRPVSVAAFDGARRLLLNASDAEGLKELWSKARPDQAYGLALDLEQVEAYEAAVEVWRSLDRGDTSNLGIWSQLEVALSRVDAWREVYDIATRRAETVVDEDEREVIHAKRRWLLAQKLAETDEAWSLYQSLHEENSDDRDVTSALARIAMARGETRMAIGFLENLAQGASDPKESAALQVRIAEVHEHAQNVADARQALFDALDYVPDYQPALEGLKKLAATQDDWKAMLDVLKLEQGRVKGDRKIEVLREIARLNAEHVDDDGVVLEAWRSVLDAAPDDVEALRASLELAEKKKSWESYLDLAVHLAEHLSGAERTEVLGRAGLVGLDELERASSVDLLERAISEGPSYGPAADRLVSWYRGRGERDQVVRVLSSQADGVADPEKKGSLYADAAEILQEARQTDKAIELYKKAIHIRPDEPRALRYLADHLFERGEIAEALPVFERLAPTVAEGQDLDDFDVRMELSTFFHRLARMLIDKDRAGEALSYAERALEFNPSHQPTLEMAAPLLIANESWDRAYDVLRQLLQLSGGQGEPKKVARMYAQLGLVERALGRSDKARKHFDKALSRVPHHVDALKGLALLHEDHQEWTQLLDIYNGVIGHATEPSDVTAAYLTKGRILDDQMGRADKAAQHYERSLAYDANQPQVLLRLAELAWRRNDWDETAAQAQRGLDLIFNPSPLRADLWLCLAAARHGLGQRARAHQALDRARSDAPDLDLGEQPLVDLEALRVRVRSRLPK
ncbi:MAG: hypothetical protein EA397_13965 [Deltaproteobacteria bacterium]|nr:MAG: hypothetical protein EA397_13965 [Deltaproteobacteria bacterium]